MVQRRRYCEFSAILEKIRFHATIQLIKQKQNTNIQIKPGLKTKNTNLFNIVGES